MEFWVPVVVGLFVVGCFTGFVANTKHRDGVHWFVLGFLFGPIALLAIGLVPAMTRERIEEEENRWAAQKMAEHAKQVRSTFQQAGSDRLRRYCLSLLREQIAELER